MKQIKYVTCLICILCLLSVCFSHVSAMPVQENTVQTQVETADVTVTNGCHGIDAAQTVLGPQSIFEGNASAIVYETNSDTLVYSVKADERRYPSSLVKIMTALIAVERGNLDDMITVRADLISSLPDDAVSANLKSGERISLRDLIYCMMVSSANDATVVIADHIAGDQQAFVIEMNNYAQSLNCTGTNFTNVHGLHDENQYTTPRDMMRILITAVKNEDFLTFFSTVHYTVGATNMSDERVLSSGNFLMNTDDLQIYYDSRATGGKTGIAVDGRRCLAASAEHDGMNLLCVVMGAESIISEKGTISVYGGFNEASALFDASFNNYKTVQILFPDQIIKQNAVLNGANDVVLAAVDSVYAVLPEGATTAELNYRFSDISGIEAPVSKGDTISTVQVWYGNTCIGQTDVIAMNSVPYAIPVADDSSGAGLSGWWIALIVVLVLIVGFLLYKYSGLIRHMIKVRRNRKPHKRRR